MSCFEEIKLTQLKDLSFVSYSYSVSSGHIQKYPRKLGLYTIYGWSFEFTVLLLARLFVFLLPRIGRRCSVGNVFSLVF